MTYRPVQVNCDLKKTVWPNSIQLEVVGFESKISQQWIENYQKTFQRMI